MSSPPCLLSLTFLVLGVASLYRGAEAYHPHDHDPYYSEYDAYYSSGLRGSSVAGGDAYTPCHGMCNGNGHCTAPYSVCECFDGWTGADCSQRSCPLGPAWADVATADDTAHAWAECSNRGHCDRVTGECVCEFGLFEGSACERRSCPNNCNMKGRCVSASRLAAMQDPGEQRKDSGCTSAHICQDVDCNDRDYDVCWDTLAYSLPWDADMMYGCVCGEGYEGYDCSLRSCPTGDDPLTTSQQNEVQLLECQATDGTFTLSFMGHTTKPISVHASAIQFTDALNQLTTLTKSATSSSSILVSWLPGETTACTETGNDIQIEFLQNFGDLPLLVPDGSLLTHSTADNSPLITAQKVVTGSKESDVCSNRGTCSEVTGLCSCEEGWTTSDGNGNVGTRGDCGHLAEGTTSACPGVPECLGFGSCSGPPEYRCECQEGRYGPDCAQMSCPMGKSWFSPPSASNAAHEMAECSDMGNCDSNTGTCFCADGFKGSACEFMTCPGRPDECSGNGQCKDMASLSEEAEQNGNPIAVEYGIDPNSALTWDADQMLGCLCNEGYEGYDCSLRSCPKGDDPSTIYQENEVQHLACTDDDDDGTFRVSFRGQKTALLHATNTVDELKAALNALTTVEGVKVEYTDVDIYVGATGLDADALQLCRASGQSVNIEFLAPTGDVPLVKVDSGDMMGISGSIDVTEHIKGTKEYIDCSSRGLCDHTLGECECFAGYSSSDGQGGPGSRGDCGYKNPYGNQVRA